MANNLQWCSLRQLDVFSRFNPGGARGIGAMWRTTRGGAVVGFWFCLPTMTDRSISSIMQIRMVFRGL